MTLRVPFIEFAPTVKRVLGIADAYISAHPGGSLVTSASADSATVVVAVCRETTEEAKVQLERQGLAAWNGAWAVDGSIEDELAPPFPAHVAAVAYRTSEDRPGLWVDAFDGAPSEVAVLEAMYDEFIKSGQIDPLPFEAFIEKAKVNVVILSPEEQAAFITQKKAEPC